VIVTFARANRKATTLQKLKDAVEWCLSKTNRINELMETEDFLLMMQHLLDQSLLSTGKSSLAESFVGTRGCDDLLKCPIHLLMPMEEVAEALKSELTDRSDFYDALGKHARELVGSN
jgi:hypothetical protein